MKYLLYALLVFIPLNAAADGNVISIDDLQYAAGKVSDSPESALRLDYQPLKSTLQMEKLLTGANDVIWVKSEFTLPEILLDEKLSILTGKIIMAEEIYINGQFIGKSGSMGPKIFNNWNHYRYYSVEKCIFSSNNLLLIKVFGEGEMDIRGRIRVGKRSELENQFKWMYFFTEKLNFYITLLLLCFAVFPFVTFLQNKKRVDALYFSLILLFYSVFSTNYFTTILFDTSDPPIGNLLQQQITFVALDFTLLYMYLMVRIFLKQEHDARKTAAAYIITFTVSAAYLISPDYSFFKTVRIISYIPIFTAFVLIMAMVAKEVFKRNGEAILMSLCLFPMFVIMVHDMLYSMNAIYRWNLRPLISFDGGTIYFMSYGGSLFLVIFSLIATTRYTKNVKIIESMNRSLEIKIMERTAELSQEKNKLEAVNRTMMKELELARKIQLQLMPSGHPADYISSFYYPMSQVGGDLYEFIQFDDGRMGVFISDVSGHGVPSAFITLMIKAILLETGSGFDDPSAALRKLNDILAHNTGGHYITAIYGIYSPGDRKFKYSTAGHYPPMIVSSDGCEALEIHPSYPLAMMPTDRISESGKDFSNREITLQKGSKLLLFTDGFIDAKSGDDPSRMFQYDRMKEILVKYSHLENTEFTGAVYDDLRNFTGGLDFDDDICLICIDVK